MAKSFFVPQNPDLLYLQTLINNGMLSDASIAKMVNEDLNKNIEKRINEVHVKKDGSPRTIREPQDNRKGLWGTNTPDRKEVFAKTKEELYQKLYAYYFGEDSDAKEAIDTTLSGVWKKAHEYYCERHPDKNKTIQCHISDYKRFIDDELGNMEIAAVTTDTLESYAIKLCREIHPTVKAYKSFKGVLNLIFRYALRHSEEYRIKYNPVECMENIIVRPYLNQSLSNRSSEDLLHTPEEIEAIFNEADKRGKQTQFHGYYIYSFMLKVHDELGCRPGELVALKWDDITEDIDGNPIVHIHAQQINMRKNAELRYVPYTKNEKGISKGGRYFPVSESMSYLLEELKTLQKENGISSDFIFCNRDGKWIDVKLYSRMLKSICDSLGIKSKGSYAFRRDVNNAMYEAGINDINRSRAIGNGPLTNVVHYVHPKREYTEVARTAINQRNKERSVQVRTLR